MVFGVLQGREGGAVEGAAGLAMRMQGMRPGLRGPGDTGQGQGTRQEYGPNSVTRFDPKFLNSNPVWHLRQLAIRYLSVRGQWF
jgi:hypothetical protein